MLFDIEKTKTGDSEIPHRMSIICQLAVQICARRNIAIHLSNPFEMHEDLNDLSIGHTMLMCILKSQLVDNPA